MVPSDIESYIGNTSDVRLEVHYFDEDHGLPTYWIGSGIAALQLTEDALLELRDILIEFTDTSPDRLLQTSGYIKAASFLILFGIALMGLGVLINA